MEDKDKRVTGPGTGEVDGSFRGEQPFGMVADMVVDATGSEGDDTGLWIPQVKGVHFWPLLFNVTEGYFVNILRVRRSGVLSRHRHVGPVHAYVIEGRWHYLEHEWWAERGSYVFEPPGEIHTLEVPNGIVEMQTLFHVTGAYIYVDRDGRPEGIEDVFTKLEATRAHYESRGLPMSAIDKLVR